MHAARAWNGIPWLLDAVLCKQLGPHTLNHDHVAMASCRNNDGLAGNMGISSSVLEMEDSELRYCIRSSMFHLYYESGDAKTIWRRCPKRERVVACGIDETVW